MKTLQNDALKIDFLPIPDSTEGLGVRFVLGGWISNFITKDGYSFISEKFPKDRVVGFGFPDEFITPMMIGDDPGSSMTGIKIGVGIIKLFRPGNYRFTEEPGVVEVFPWEVRDGSDFISWSQEVDDGGIGYRLKKEVRFLPDEVGFKISLSLLNVSLSRPIQTLWYYHPFVAPGGMGSDCYLEIPDAMRPAYDFIKVLDNDGDGRLRLPGDFSDIPTQLLEFSPADMGLDNRFFIGNVNHDLVLEISGDFPLAFLRLWYEPRVFSPEPFYYIRLMPKEEIFWSVTNRII